MTTNHTVAHQWANQNRQSGKSNNGNFSFEGRRLYSYSTLVGYISDLVDAKGRKVVFASSRSYSATTSGKHYPARNSALSDDRLRVLWVDVLPRYDNDEFTRDLYIHERLGQTRDHVNSFTRVTALNFEKAKAHLVYLQSGAVNPLDLNNSFPKCKSVPSLAQWRKEVGLASAIKKLEALIAAHKPAKVTPLQQARRDLAARFDLAIQVAPRYYRDESDLAAIRDIKKGHYKALIHFAYMWRARAEFDNGVLPDYAQEIATLDVKSLDVARACVAMVEQCREQGLAKLGDIQKANEARQAAIYEARNQWRRDNPALTMFGDMLDKGLRDLRPALDLAAWRRGKGGAVLSHTHGDRVRFGKRVQTSRGVDVTLRTGLGLFGAALVFESTGEQIIRIGFNIDGYIFRTFERREGRARREGLGVVAHVGCHTLSLRDAKAAYIARFGEPIDEELLMIRAREFFQVQS
jgi:hypothetical protein